MLEPMDMVISRAARAAKPPTKHHSWAATLAMTTTRLTRTDGADTHTHKEVVTGGTRTAVETVTVGTMTKAAMGTGGRRAQELQVSLWTWLRRLSTRMTSLGTAKVDITTTRTRCEAFPTHTSCQSRKW